MKSVLKKQNEEKSKSPEKKKTHENEKPVEVPETKIEINLKKEAVGRGILLLFRFFIIFYFKRRFFVK